MNYELGGLTMIERDEARKRAEEHLSELLRRCNDYKIALQLDRIEEREFGWIFFYGAAKRLKTGLKPIVVAGNAPFIVERASGRVMDCGTAFPIDHYIDNYLKTGNPHGELGETVLLLAANQGAQKISAVKSIRKYTGLGLGAAKQCIDQCLDGKAVELKTANATSAQALSNELRALFFVAEQVKRPPNKGMEPTAQNRTLNR
jgi:hypothetical protein